MVVFQDKRPGVESHEDCATACANDDTCVVWSFNTAIKVCALRYWIAFWNSIRDWALILWKHLCLETLLINSMVSYHWMDTKECWCKMWQWYKLENKIQNTGKTRKRLELLHGWWVGNVGVSLLQQVPFWFSLLQHVFLLLFLEAWMSVFWKCCFWDVAILSLSKSVFPNFLLTKSSSV